MDTNASSQGPISRRDIAFVMVVLVGSLGLNVLLGVNKSRRAQGPPPAPIAIGETMPALHVRDLKGVATDIDMHDVGKPTVLYVFTPTCVWCAKNLPKIQELGKQKGDAFRFIGLSLTSDGLGPYLDKADLPFPVYSTPSAETMAKYHLNGTPQTLVLDQNSRVVQVWMGAYLPDTNESVSKFFSVKLPSLAEGMAEFGPGRIVCYDPKGRAFSPGAEFPFDGETHICGSDGHWRTLRTGV